MTSNPSIADVLSLADRVEKASGPDRELDADIALAVHGGEIVWKQANGTMEAYPARRYASGMHVGGFGHAPVDAVTSSLDAAMTLASRPELERFGGAIGLLRQAIDRLCQTGEPADLPRYLTASVLRAIASEMKA